MDQNLTQDVCPICLEEYEAKSFLDTCLHPYCFRCIMQWSQGNNTCPLCKTEFKKIIHNIKSDYVYDEYEIGIQPTALTDEEIRRRIEVYNSFDNYEASDSFLQRRSHSEGDLNTANFNEPHEVLANVQNELRRRSNDSVDSDDSSSSEFPTSSNESSRWNSTASDMSLGSSREEGDGEVYFSN